MVRLDDAQEKFMMQNIPNGEQIIRTGNVNDVLDALTSWMARNAFGADDEITDEGRRVERMYDDIYRNN